MTQTRPEFAYTVIVSVRVVHDYIPDPGIVTYDDRAQAVAAVGDIAFARAKHDNLQALLPAVQRQPYTETAKCQVLVNGYLAWRVQREINYCVNDDDNEFDSEDDQYDYGSKPFSSEFQESDNPRLWMFMQLREQHYAFDADVAEYVRTRLKQDAEIREHKKREQQAQRDKKVERARAKDVNRETRERLLLATLKAKYEGV